VDLSLMGYIIVTIMHIPIRIAFTARDFSGTDFIVQNIHEEWHIACE
jgi:hypothetical protein